MRLPLSTAIPVFLLAVGLGAVAVSAALVSWRVPAEAMQEAESNTTLLASLQAAEIAYYMRQGDRRDALKVLERLNADRSLIGALLVDDEGQVILANRNVWRGRPLADTPYAFAAEAVRRASRRSTHRTWSEPEECVVFSVFPVMMSPDETELVTSRTGAFLIHRDVSTMVAERLAFTRELLAWLAGVIAVMSLALWWFLRSVLLNRVSGLVGRLDQIGHPDFASRDGKGGTDELSRIEDSLEDASRNILEARRQNERLRQLYQTLSEANQSIIRLPDAQSVFERICEVIVQYGGFPLVWIGEPDDNHRLVRVAASGDTDSLKQLDLYLEQADRTLAGRAFHSGEAQVANDIETPGTGLVLHDPARRLDFAAMAVFPLRRDGSVVALMVVHAKEAGFFDQTETGLLNELAGDVSFALDNYSRAESLRQSEERHRRLFLSNPHPMWIYDLATLQFLEVNDTAVRHYGYSREEFLSMTIADIRPPEDVEALRKNVAAVTEGIDDAGVWRHLRKDGSILDVEITSHTLVWKDRHAELVLANDITERLEAERQLRIAAAAFEAQEGIVVADTNNVIERVNRAFTHITGYQSSELVGQTPAILQSGYHDAAFYEEMWREITEQGFWEGEIWNRRKSGEVYPQWMTISVVKDAQGQVTHYVGSCLDITEDKEAEKKIHRLAFYDPLTDLANRRLLIDRLGRAAALSSRNGTCGAVLMLDFDHFKMLNDTRGHAAGDALLIEAAKRLKSGLRESDSVARMGGDEFIAVLEGLHPEEDTAAAEAVRRAHQLQSTLSQPYQLPDAADYRIGLCVGIALFKGHDLGVDELLKQADVALYEAKSEGRNTLRFFNPERQRAIEVRAQMEEKLRRALQRNEFELHYQPQVDRLGRITGAEALLRWNPPGRGPVSPAEFIPVAEESGQILAVSHWVLNAALKQLRAWQNQDLTAHLTLSINISAKHFHQPEFVKEVETHLKQTGADPSGVFFELTENVSLQPVDRITRQFESLKALDIRFSIDDFGTGYSSLSYIQRLPVQQIKIDRAFIDDVPDNPNAVAVVQAVLAMSHAFGLSVVAEGVETAEQLAFLQEEGCDAYQGFYFGRPVPAADFEALLRNRVDG